MQVAEFVKPVETVLVTRYHDFYASDMIRLCNGMNTETLNDYGMTISADRIKYWTEICREIGFILVVNGRAVGLIGAIQVNGATNGAKVLQEIFWFVEREHRKHSTKLLRMLEEQARCMGAKAIVMSMMISQQSERLEKFYERRGYKKIEIQFMKEIA